MTRWNSRLGWFGLLGLAWLVGSGESQAWDNPFVKVSNVRFNVHVEFSTTPDPLRPTAPWYTYFPADPRLLPSPQLSPYPPWPAPFPPPGRPFDVPKDAPKQLRDTTATPGPMLTQFWSSQLPYASYLQPVGYMPTQAPSYWYQHR